MNTDIQDALSSVTEVAIFAWSLLELLLMRILPLVGFLTCHLLLQFGSLLSSGLAPGVGTSPAANRSRSAGRMPRASTEYSYSWEELQAVEEEVVEEADDVHAVKSDRHIWGVPQAQEVAQELLAEEVEKVPLAVKKEDDRQNSSAESLKSSDEEHGEISPRTSDERAPNPLPSIAENEETEAAATSAEAALPTSAPPEEQVTDSGTEKPALHSDDMHVAESSPSDVQKNALPPSGKHADKAKKPAAGHVSSKAEGSAGKVDVKPSDTWSARSEEKRKMSGGGGAEMRKSRSSRGSRSILRVLPPSLFQVERTLRQRSRRVSFSQD